MSQLAEDARALITATADVAGEQVGEARKRLAAALDSGKHLYGVVREKAVEGAKKTLTYAIAGLIIILLSYLILVLIKTITGVDVTTFSISQP